MYVMQSCNAFWPIQPDPWPACMAERSLGFLFLISLFNEIVSRISLLIPIAVFMRITSCVGAAQQ